MISGMNHVGLSVSRLERSLAFYRDLLGLTVIEDGFFEGTQYDRIFRLREAKGRVALLSGAGFQLELFEFEQPLPASRDPLAPVCNHGISHICLEVDDLNALYNQLLAARVDFHTPPSLFFGSVWATYARDPDGNVIEFIEYERGRSA
jgi:catechol 2,3-dioxygenase-like lactoylglutathione lyase family enzyme